MILLFTDFKEKKKNTEKNILTMDFFLMLSIILFHIERAF